MSKILVTGAEGFVAGHLISLLESQGHEIYRFDIKTGEDFRDYEQVRLAIDKFRPDKIFHIGALAFVPESFLDPLRAIETDIVGSLNILTAVRNIGLKTKIHLCGTSEEYGDAPEPVVETSLPNPLSPYAVAKLAMTNLGLLYARSYNMDIVITRTFNHTGPGRGEQYAESSFAKQIAEIEVGKRKELLHGDLEPVRNYTDVRDVVRAYSLAIDLPSGVYNVCSDQNIVMEDVLTMLRTLAQCPIQTKQDKNLLRPADFSFNRPNADKFKALSGWEPEYTFPQTLQDILEYWRERV